MSTHPDLRSEQAYIDRAYDRLEAMRRAAEDLRDSVIDAGPGGTHQARVERDVFVQTSLQRLEQLQLGRASLIFGRIDRDAPDADAEGPVERFYVGRLAVSDERQDPLVVDWRAPVAEAFYRATGRAPMGLRRRRHFATEGRALVAIEDEVFAADGDADGELVGPGALLAALQRSRSGQMRDIVATVQREQDEVIRADLPGVLVVQGGPGTGKTAVALHRAAYLLYTYRFPLEQQGVLVVGPNQVFLRYIEQVLPSLGESGVALSTLAGLVPSVRARGVDSAPAARVKGDARMATVLGRAVSDRQRPLRHELAVGFGSVSLRVSAAATRAIVNTVRRRPGTHNGRRRQVEAMLVRALHERYVAGLARARGGDLDPDVVSEDGGALGLAEFGSQVRHLPEVVAALDRMWPTLAPEDLLNDLLGSSALLSLAAGGVLSESEQDALLRPRARTLETVVWTPGDVPLLDEARALLGPMRVRRGRGGDDAHELRGYGHIVVDEAQDLSAMALRLLARRSISGSMTLVGDIGQATTAGAAAGWGEVLRHLPARRPPRLVSLTVNYRTPAEIMEAAAEVLAAATGDSVAPPRSVRATGRVPVARSVDAESLPDEVAAAAAELVRAGDGTVAVIGSTAALPALASALEAAGLPWGEPERSGLSAPITLLDVPSVKGLEFDGVVVAEPAAIVAEPGGGLRSLFVALTRPTRRLIAVHAAPLPESLVRGLVRARSRPAESIQLLADGVDGDDAGLAV
jgi:DNA helicase IV